MASYTMKLMTTGGQLVQKRTVQDTDLLEALRAYNLTGREIGDAKHRAMGKADGRSDDHGGQYVTWTKDEQVIARRATPGTTVYITTTQGVAAGSTALATREHTVVVGTWMPSRSLGQGYADLYDVDGRFHGAYAADDLLHIVPSHRRRPVASWML